MNFPDAVEDYSPVMIIHLSSRWRGARSDSEPKNAQFLTALGAVLLRAGHFDEAQETLLFSLGKAASEETSLGREK